MQDKTLWSIEETAQRLGVRPSTVREGVKKGIIPAVVLWRGRKRSLVRFDPEAIERLIQSRSTTSVATR